MPCALVFVFECIVCRGIGRTDRFSGPFCTTRAETDDREEMLLGVGGASAIAVPTCVAYPCLVVSAAGLLPLARAVIRELPALPRVLAVTLASPPVSRRCDP